MRTKMPMGQDFKCVEILLVEDNPVDVLVTKRALQGGKRMQ